MNRIDNFSRIRRLIDYCIAELNLNLEGLSVLTETASGPFVVTPLIAALAGSSNVIAVTRDSRFGTAKEVIEYSRQWASELGVLDSIEFTTKPAREFAPAADIITNLGHVRPIDAEFVAALRPAAAIALMFETWEYRPEDVDLQACHARGIPVLGTNERDPRLNIFRYVGVLCLKLMLEANLEVFKSSVLLVGTNPFGDETEAVLQQNGCCVDRIVPCHEWIADESHVRPLLERCDAVVVVENNIRSQLLGPKGKIPTKWLPDDLTVIHVCGNVDAEALRDRGICKTPEHDVPPGWMTVTTDYVGPRPVIELHAAGLAVGAALSRSMHDCRDSAMAIRYAMEHSPAMEFEPHRVGHEIQISDICGSSDG